MQPSGQCQGLQAYVLAKGDNKINHDVAVLSLKVRE